ncbi:MAG: hypothetical protein Q9221_006382 [Calogaya cf. arnoldii]
MNLLPDTQFDSQMVGQHFKLRTTRQLLNAVATNHKRLSMLQRRVMTAWTSSNNDSSPPNIFISLNSIKNIKYASAFLSVAPALHPANPIHNPSPQIPRSIKSSKNLPYIPAIMMSTKALVALTCLSAVAIAAPITNSPSDAQLEKRVVLDPATLAALSSLLAQQVAAILKLLGAA